jgi:hypothetical protein
MVKAWLIVFMFWHSPNDMSLEEPKFMGKVEIPYASMNTCIKAKNDLTMESEDLRYRFICVTDDHHSGRKPNPNIPLD